MSRAEGRSIGRRILVMMAIVSCAGCATRRTPHAAPTPIQCTVRAESPHRADELGVAAYNVHGLRKREAIRDDLAALDSRVNVWCFQEVSYVDAFDFGRLLPPGPWHVAVLPLNRQSREWESQVIASRFPLERVTVWPLSDPGRKRRAALAARITIDGRSVLIVNTDHEPSILAWRSENAAQTRRLVEHLRDCGDTAVVVAGDFNCSGNLYRVIGNSAHVRRTDDALAACGFAPLKQEGPTFRCGVVRSRLDRIYARNLRVADGAIATRSRGSDHLPVWGRFELMPPVTKASISGAASAQ